MKNIDSEGAYRVYSYRWVVLAIYGLSTAVIQLMWTTFFSITTQAWQYYGFTDAQEGENAISLLSIIFMAGMIVLSIPVMAAFEKYGFKKAVGFGVVLTGICAIVRGVFGDSYTAVLVATVGFAVAQPFLLNSPGLVAGKWFPENERATANSVGLLCSYVGMCLGLLLTPVMLDAGMTIKGMLTAYGVLGVVTAVLFVAFVKEKPPTPPCAEEDAVPDLGGNVRGTSHVGRKRRRRNILRRGQSLRQQQSRHDCAGCRYGTLPDTDVHGKGNKTSEEINGRARAQLVCMRALFHLISHFVI